MVDRWWPLHPDLERVGREAEELLRDYRAGDPAATATFREHLPHAPRPTEAHLADARSALARGYGFPDWPLLVLSSRMTAAIWADDAATVRALATAHPEVVRHHAHRNWGPPLSFAANLGRDRIVDTLLELGATDVQWAFARACLAGRIGTARRLHARGGRPEPGSVMGPCETQNDAGLALLLELGAELSDGGGDPLAPVGMVLETYARNPEGKHRCLALMAERGVALPDTPTLAVHRGRIDLLEAHLRRDPGLMTRTFTHREIYPLELGCHADESLALHATPLAGGTLLHLCVDYDELEMARWLLDQGADVNARAALDRAGFGGHTALFGCVVSQPYRNGRQRDGACTRLLLAAGADPDARASLRKRLRGADDESEHTYHDVTPRQWGQGFHDQAFVNPAAMALLASWPR